MSEDASPLLFSISAAPTINSFGASKIRGSPLLANAADSTINFFSSAANLSDNEASATNAGATRATDGQRRHQRDAGDGAIATRVTTPAVLSGREGGGGRRSVDVVLPGQEGSGVRL